MPPRRKTINSSAPSTAIAEMGRAEIDQTVRRLLLAGGHVLDYEIQIRPHGVSARPMVTLLDWSGSREAALALLRAFHEEGVTALFAFCLPGDSGGYEVDPAYPLLA